METAKNWHFPRIFEPCSQKNRLWVFNTHPCAFRSELPEVLDASFSFDGVIGAFAITKDIVLIMLGLGIGAMFVRSMTVFLVEKGTLNEYIYLEHGAHWAIGILATLMLVSMFVHVPEVITGLIGVGFIGAAFFSSIREKKNMQYK